MNDDDTRTTADKHAGDRFDLCNGAPVWAASRIATLEAEVARLGEAQAKLEDLHGRISTVLDLLAANGCDCECDCDNNHNDDCDRCLACRVAANLAGIEVTP